MPRRAGGDRSRSEGVRRKGQNPEPLLTPNEWVVVKLALETQERVMLERGAHPAAEAARLVRQKLSHPQ